MQQALAGDILDWLAEPSGECDRPKLFDVLNECRERFYQLYPAITLFEIEYCFELQTFCSDCNVCDDMYRGVTLPRDYQNAEAIWNNDFAVTMNSSWREWQRGGLSPYCDCGLSKFDMPGLYSSERDLRPRMPARLGVNAVSQADVGKQVTLRGIDIFGVAREQVLTLGIERVFTDHIWRSINRGSGFSKPRTEGPVIFSEENGRILSIYSPDETMPGYRRIKITGAGGGRAQLNVRGMRRYFPVFKETDVVELDNRTALTEMARFIRVNKKVSKDSSDLRTASFALDQVRAALEGDKARDAGKTAQATMRVESIGFGPPRLGQSYG